MNNFKPNQDLATLIFLIALLLIPLLPFTTAITGQDTSGTYTVTGQATSLSTNATGPYETRGLMDYISGWFKYPSLTEILYRGRFSILKATNTAPAPPSLELPLNNTFTNTTSITFSWTNTTDADNDTLSYRIEIYNNSALTQEYHINNSIVETATPTSTLVNLTDDSDYYWRVLANDTSKNSSFSDLYIITLDTTLPANFNLISPNGTSSTDNTPTLEWEASTDTNLQNYTIELSTESNFSNINITQEATTNTFSNWSSILDAATYYWRVTAVDKANNQRLSDNNLSFTITALTETTSITQGVTTVAGGITPKPYSFHLLAPPSITIFKDESIIVPLNIENSGNQINLNRITLTAEADIAGVDVTLDKTFINTLRPNSNTTLNLIINAAGAETNLFSISVTANVDIPRLSDSVRIITNIIGEEETTLETAQQQLIFAKKFFDGNPECQDLIENLDKAEFEIDQGNYALAHDLLTEAVNACKDLIAIKVTKKPNLLDITFNVVKENKTTAIISSQVLAFFIILLVIFRKFIRRRPKQPKLDF